MSSAASVAAYVPPARLSRYQRNLKSAVADGRLSCGIESHHRVRSWVDPQTQRTFSDVERRPLRELYDMMMPAQVAKCACLKAACEAQWNRNFHMAYTTTAISPGSYTKGLDCPGSAPKRIYVVRFTLKPDILKFLIGRFPEWFFVSMGASDHDHPIAHTSTRICGDRLLANKLRIGTPAAPSIYVDLHGNPGANEAFMARNPGIRIITVVQAITPKDYVRVRVKWGPRLDAAGNTRWIDASVRDLGLGTCDALDNMQIDGFISLHTLYYYDQAEVVRLLNRFDCPMHAAHHRFSSQSGSLNNGEQTYVKRMRSTQNIVYQTNTLTGQVYDHPDNSVWFDHDSFTYGQDGVGWDHNLLCDETFYTLIVPCPAVQCNMSTRCLNHAGVINNSTLPVNASLVAPSQSEIARTNLATVTVCGVSHTATIQTQHVEFLGEMRKAVIGKARTAAQYRDHVSRCKIALASKEKSNRLVMDAQQLEEIARISFFIDFVDQHESDKQMFGAAYMRTISADSLYKEGGGHVTSGCITTLCNMLLAASESKNIVQAVARSGRAGLLEFNRRV